jgi:catechol 2,3-dioxygenase-like lactoylglutathione lyase family enzyme
LVTGFNHYNLVAERRLLDELREFYVSVVGLRPGPRPPFKRFGYWLYAGAQDVLHLTEALTDEARGSNVISTFDHVAFTATDLLSAVARVTAHGIAFHIDDVPLAGQRQMFFSDPAGNGVELNFELNSLPCEFE